MKKLILFFAALCCMTLAHADVIWRTSCKPTSTQRGFTIGCYEDTATGKIYTNKSCDYERNAAEVVWYSKLKTCPVSDDGGREVKEADVHMGFPFFWAADNSMGRYDQGTKSVEFKASDSGIANARLKWYANGIVAIGHNIKIAVKVNGTLVDEYYCRNNKMDALEMVNSVPLVGLKAGDVVTFETIKDANDNESYATIAASLEYTGTDVSDGPHLPITVAADDQRRMVDAADPELTWQLTGALFPGDNLANITINRETGEASGTYAIVVSQSQGANPDYDINFVPSTFTIVNSAHRMPATATFRTRGFSQECWEDLTNGKLYADGYFKQELNPGLVISYAKLLDNPITELNGFRLSDTFAFNGATFDWGPQSMVVFYPSDPSDPHYTGPEDIQRHVDFTVLGTNVADARVKWYKGLTDRWGGPLYVNIYVNGEKVYSQRHANGLVLEDVYTHSLPDLKTGDVVRFEVYVVDSDYPSVTMNFAACLEYTSSNGGKEATVDVTAKQDNRNKGSYYATFYSSTCAYKVPDGVTAY
ncbi:MAG: hypothetical protein KBT10_09160, partial [Bacteroidales bacterium]|nr:hypothetical protein [Candidatus Sodaliphilus aphodohippi]